MEPPINDSAINSKYYSILHSSRVLSIPLIRCDQVVDKVIKQEIIDETTHNNDVQLLPIGSLFTTDIEIKTERDVIGGYEFESMVSREDHSLELINQLNSDKKSDSREKPLSFNVCSNAFSNVSKFPVNKEAETGNNHHKCDICDKILISKKNLDKHLMIHSSGREKSFMCANCNKSYYRKSDLKVHIFRHTCKNNRSHKILRYKCDNCGKEFAVESSLKKHSKTHVGETDHHNDAQLLPRGSLFTTDIEIKTERDVIGGYEFESMVSREDHSLELINQLNSDKKSDSREKPLSFNVCSNAFSNVSKFPVSKEAEIGNNHHKCDICDKILISKKNLDKHLMIHSSGREKSFICANCNKSYYRKSDLKVHIFRHTCKNNQSHTILRHKSDNCGKEFAVESSLKKHSKTHVGETDHHNDAQLLPRGSLFTTDIEIKTERDVIGGYEFESMVSREDHSLELINQLNSDKKSDSREKPLSFNVCSNAFSNVSKFPVSKEAEIGNNHHKCDICDKILISKKNLDKHLMIHSSGREKSFMCANCNKSYYRKSDLKVHIFRHTCKNNQSHTILRHKSDNCGKEFAVESSLKKHSKTHVGETDHHNDAQLLPRGSLFTTDIEIKTERDVIGGYEFESMVSREDHSLELINQLNSDKKSDSREKPLSFNVCSNAFSNVSKFPVSKEAETGNNHHKCDICDKILISKKSLDKHLMIHSSGREKSFMCANCNKSYYRKSALRIHIIRHTCEIIHNHQSLRYNCDICGKEFAVESSLKKHSRTHVGETDHHNDAQLLPRGSLFTTDIEIKTERDVIGGYEFESMVSREDHSLELINQLNSDKKSDSREKPLSFNVCSNAFSNVSKFPVSKEAETGNNHHKCDICDKILISKKNLDKHLMIHSSGREKSFICANCNKSYYRKSDLKVHIFRHTCKNNQSHKILRYKCDNCEKRFTLASSLKKHTRIHTGEKPYKCDICNEAFSQLVNLKVHTRIHTGEKPYQCVICKKEFSQAEHLKKHKRIHTDEKPFKCSVCDKAFGLAEGLRQHTRTHTGERPYKCDVCDKRFAIATNLKVHKRIHTGEKPYECKICGRRFHQASDSKKHTRTHSALKPYKCDICNKEFSQVSYVKTHMVRTHSGIKSHKCDVCNKLFSVLEGLKKHKRIHTGEKPYKCDICDRRFSITSNLKVHRRVHTGVKPYKCKFCERAFFKATDLKKHTRTLHNEEPSK